MSPSSTLIVVLMCRRLCTSVAYEHLGSSRPGFGIIPAEATMKIKALDTYFLFAPLPQPVRTSTSTISRVSELIVKLTTDAGLVGIGEAHGPFLSQGGAEGMRAVGQILERVTPLVVGQDPSGIERIWQDLF